MYNRNDKDRNQALRLIRYGIEGRNDQGDSVVQLGQYRGDLFRYPAKGRQTMKAFQTKTTKTLMALFNEHKCFSDALPHTIDKLNAGSGQML